ncbi:MAG TPA: thioredoxin-like domain-containing protein, partial [Verrucomicrobiae bacterium]|nr:thioredoxin-like domain-containing protein [Verrucomicrobiae bacterium]
IGKTAPDLDMKIWVGTKPVMDGKLIIVNIWSPRSASCRKWIPALNDLCKNFSARVAVIGVTPAPAADVMQTNPKVEFPCAIDSEGKFIAAANVTTFPCIMLLDANRAIRFQGHPAALTPETLENILGKAAESSSQ